MPPVWRQADCQWCRSPLPAPFCKVLLQQALMWSKPRPALQPQMTAERLAQGGRGDRRQKRQPHLLDQAARGEV